jgi:hypothetical protein
MPSSVPFNAADEGLASDGRAVPATSIMRSRTCRPLPREQPKTERWLSASGQAAGDKRVPLPVVGCVFSLDLDALRPGGYLIGYCGGNCRGFLSLGSTFCYLAIAVRLAEVGINSGGKQHTVITRNPSFEILSLVRVCFSPSHSIPATCRVGHNVLNHICANCLPSSVKRLNYAAIFSVVPRLQLIMSVPQYGNCSFSGHNGSLP